MKEKFQNWQESFGLALIDSEEPSSILQSIAEANIIGLIPDKEIESVLKEYYKDLEDKSNYESDLAMIRIKKILTSKTFELSKKYYIAIHKYIFSGTSYNGGCYRTYPISKKEPILHGDTVIYSPFEELDARLDYDFEEQKSKKMKGLTPEETIKLIIPFTSNIWQNHPFKDGNTRTTSIFIEKYLKSLGFDINNDIFKENSVYFRNALVRNNPTTNRSLTTTDEFLYKFFYKLLVDDSIILDPQEEVIHPRKFS